MCELLQCVNSTAQYVNSNNFLLPKAKRVKKKNKKSKIHEQATQTRSPNRTYITKN